MTPVRFAVSWASMRGRIWRRGLAGVVLVAALTGIGLAQPPPQLSEVQRLKAENLKLQFALLQQQEAQLREAAARLEAQRVALEAEFRQTLQPPAGSAFNWTTYSFDKPPTADAATGGAATGAPAPTNGDRKPQR